MLLSELFETMGATSTYSSVTNPETGKLYTKAELRAKYPQTATTPAVTKPEAPTVDVSQVAPATPAGAPTADERAALEKRIQQALGTAPKKKNTP